MLKALALHLHGGEDEAVAHKVRRVAHSLRRLEAVNYKIFVLNYNGDGKCNLY